MSRFANAFMALNDSGSEDEKDGFTKVVNKKKENKQPNKQKNETKLTKSVQALTNLNNKFSLKNHINNRENKIISVETKIVTPSNTDNININLNNF